GHLLLSRGAPVVAVASRSRTSAARVAEALGGVKPVDVTELPALASRALIAVSDDGVSAVAEALEAPELRGGIALIASGARGPDALEALRSHGVACGLLHPLQSIAREDERVDVLEGISFGVAGDSAARTWADEIVSMAHGRVLPLA